MKKALDLSSGENWNISAGPVPALVRIPIDEHCKTVVKKKATVCPGMLIAEHDNPGKGDVFSPVHGVVTETAETFIIIKAEEAPKDETAQQEAQTLPQPPEPCSLDGLSRDELRTTLKQLGIDTDCFPAACTTLIVNGLNPEPCMQQTKALQEAYSPILQKGLALATRILEAKTCITALEKGTNHLSGTAPKEIPPRYPNSIPKLLRAKVLGKEDGQDAHVISLHTLFILGSVATTGLPLQETLVNVQGNNYKVLLGSSVGALLAHAGLTVEDGDTIVLNGLLQGTSIDDPDQGITAATQSITLVKAHTHPPVTDDQCILCGACVPHCPARLNPGMLSRYAEFSMLDQCRKEHLDACIECGLCSYYCIVRRPVIQYLRLAKHQMGKEHTAQNES